MAKMKKVLAIAMAAAMGMSMLAGCGGQGKDDVTEATSQAETSEAATSEEKTEEAASEEAFRLRRRNLQNLRTRRRYT